MRKRESDEEYKSGRIGSSTFKEALESKSNTISLKKFWRWSDYRHYVLFYFYFITCYFLFYTLFYGETVIQATGVFTNMFDACVALPQAIKNYKGKSVKSLRYD